MSEDIQRPRGRSGTIPFLSDQIAEELSEQSEAQNAWHNLMNSPLVQAWRAAAEEANRHKHGPFVFLLNQNHNALRGCTTCGAAWVGLMAGLEENLCWHSIQEPPEEE